MPEDGIRFVEKDAFVMPVVPPELRIRPFVLALLHVAAFLDRSGDDTVDPDWAVEAMEHVAYYLKRLDPESVRELRVELDRLASWAADTVGSEQLSCFFRDFIENFGVGEPV